MKNEVTGTAPLITSTRSSYLNSAFDDIMGNAMQMKYAVNTDLTFYSIWCNGINIVFGIVGIIILAILLLVLVPLMLLDSPGPIFYYQQRIGYKGKSFWIIKIRSMRQNAEQSGQVVWATKHDTRVTRIGHFLRATHLDELPQVINILRGEMSLIGPRPEREVYVRELEQLHPEYNARLLVKPGLTGLAQVNYGYGDGSKSELEKLQYDLFYVQQRTIKMDIRILLKTVIEVVGGHGV